MTGEVRRDAWGIPHVVADDVVELAQLQGRAVAADRAWQLEHGRRRAEGRTAALLGTGSVPWDVFARRARLEELGRRAYDGLAAESRAFVDAYVAGVNEGLASADDVPELGELGVRAGTWSPWTPLALFAANHVLFATFPAKLWRRHAEATVGEELAALFHHEGSLGAGSNSWVVGGARTASGLPLLAGDPHRSFESPNVYQQVRLTCTDPHDAFDVVGFTFPGVPGVQHFAHAGSVAWGITNAMADYQDVYVERLERRGDEVWAEGPDGWARAERSVEQVEVRGGTPVDVEVVRTDRGPVVVGGPDEHEALSLRTPAYALGDVGLDCLLPLLRARSSSDVLTALAGWVEPVNNLLVADVDGEVRQRVVGRVPERPEPNRWRPVPAWEPGAAWSGWVDAAPEQAVPPTGHLVTANNRMNADFDRIGVEFAPPGRADRIDALLAGREGLVADDMAAVHRDVLAGQPAALLTAVARVPELSPAGAALRDELLGWDQHLHAGSTTAAGYVAVRDSVVARLADRAELAPLAVASPYGALLQPWFELEPQMWLALPNLLSAEGRRVLPGLDELVGDALEEVAESFAADPTRPTWGERHRYRPLHPLGHGLPEEPPLAGDNDCVRCTGALPGASTVHRGSVARYVWDLAGQDRSGWVVPLGASGDPREPHHHDQLPAWVAGTLLPVSPPT